MNNEEANQATLWSLIQELGEAKSRLAGAKVLLKRYEDLHDEADHIHFRTKQAISEFVAALANPDRPPGTYVPRPRIADAPNPNSISEAPDKEPQP